MAANTKKSPTSIDINPDLLKEVRHALVDRDIAFKAAVESAMRLWLDSGQLPTQKGIDSTGTSEPVEKPKIVSESDPDVLKHTSCTEDELAHVARLLTVLRSPKPHLPDAIKMNLEQFADLHEAWSRERAHSGDNAQPKAGAGKSGGVAGAEPEDPNLTKAKEGILRVAKDPGLSLPDVPGGRKPRRGPKSGTG